MKLTKERFEDACEFIKKNARPLDASLFKYYFEGGTSVEVLQELGKFQNEDGGFGHGIESDFRLKASSPMATSVGIQYYCGIDGSPNHELIKSAVRYLVSTYNSEHGYWPATFNDVNEEPHAPWWHVETISPPEGVEWANPSAELAGYLNKYSKFVPNEILKNVNHRVTTYLEDNKIIGSWLYNIMCWERVYEYFPEPIRSSAREIINDSFRSMIPLSCERLGEIRIFWLAPYRNSLLTFVAPDTVYHHLELEITEQAEDGGWWPSWKWGQYEDVWLIAEKEWAGKITLRCLQTLRELNRDYNLIERLD